MLNQEKNTVEINVYKWYWYVLDFFIWIGITYGLLMNIDNFYIAFAFAISFPFLTLAETRNGFFLIYLGTLFPMLRGL